MPATACSMIRDCRLGTTEQLEWMCGSAGARPCSIHAGRSTQLKCPSRSPDRWERRQSPWLLLPLEEFGRDGVFQHVVLTGWLLAWLSKLVGAGAAHQERTKGHHFKWDLLAERKSAPRLVKFMLNYCNINLQMQKC